MYCKEYKPYLCPTIPSEYLLVRQLLRHSCTALDVKFSEAIISNPHRCLFCNNNSMTIYRGIYRLEQYQICGHSIWQWKIRAQVNFERNVAEKVMQLCGKIRSTKILECKCYFYFCQKWKVNLLTIDRWQAIQYTPPR